MKNELSFGSVVCTQYERLLFECQMAFELWNARREQIRQAHANGVEAGRELLRLQARYAKAYNLLRKHAEDCGRCQSVSKIRRSESSENERPLSIDEVDLTPSNCTS